MSPVSDSTQERFERFHATHPEVYSCLRQYALDARRRGRRRLGIRMLWERVRWYFVVEADATEDFKLNDHFHSRYARLLEEQEPELAGMFEMRRLRS